ncbi:MAG TPA: antibiotic biosynthesis monooxygenase [Sphingomicrobium sp.]|nr:antibiotic biosynthesis monooxygenase [Sphingomicrobium sp.]
MAAAQGGEGLRMTHVRLWQFDVPEEQEARFVSAYRSDGDWTKLFAAAPGFIRTELWRNGDGIYLTADYWESVLAFEAFQALRGEEYRRLDAALEGVAGVESFLGAFNLVD